MIESKTLCEKEELLLMSNFSFSHNVFKSCLLLMCQNECLWSKGLTFQTCVLVSGYYLGGSNIISHFRLMGSGRVLCKTTDKRNFKKTLYLTHRVVTEIMCLKAFSFEVAKTRDCIVKDKTGEKLVTRGRSPLCIVCYCNYGSIGMKI